MPSKTVVDNLVEKIRSNSESESRRSSKETADLAGEDDPWHNTDKLKILDEKMYEYKGKGHGQGIK